MMEFSIYMVSTEIERETSLESLATRHKGEIFGIRSLVENRTDLLGVGSRGSARTPELGTIWGRTDTSPDKPQAVVDATAWRLPNAALTSKERTSLL